MKRILVTGFDPFGGEEINPSWEAVRRTECDRAELIRAQIPTSYERCALVMEDLLDLHHPDAVLMVGQAGGRSGVSVERVAINVMEASLPDNDGVTFVNVPIDPQGENAYFATLPIHQAAEALRQGGVKAQISNTAGTFVCNCLMYQTLRMAASRNPEPLAGFVHLPYLPQQTEEKPAGTPSMALDTMIYSLNQIIDTLVDCLEETEENEV